MRRALALGVALFALSAAAQTPAAVPSKRSLTLLFLGDNGGELAPCG